MSKRTTYNLLIFALENYRYFAWFDVLLISHKTLVFETFMKLYG
jgi:hypothetical protein